MEGINWEKVIDEGRSKIIYIGRREVLDYCAVRHGSNHVISVISTYDLPAAWFIGGVNYCAERQAFAYLIFSPNFDPVPLGAESPILSSNLAGCKITRDVDKP